MKIEKGQWQWHTSNWSIKTETHLSSELKEHLLQLVRHYQQSTLVRHRWNICNIHHWCMQQTNKFDGRCAVGDCILCLHLLYVDCWLHCVPHISLDFSLLASVSVLQAFAILARWTWICKHTAYCNSCYGLHVLKPVSRWFPANMSDLFTPSPSPIRENIEHRSNHNQWFNTCIYITLGERVAIYIYIHIYIYIIVCWSLAQRFSLSDRKVIVNKTTA